MLPLILLFMGNNSNFGAALITGASSVIGSGLGLLGSSIDYHNQKRLMSLQNQYNQENATIAYNRQRALTQDAALLEKQGKLQAGINTAFGQNGNVSSVASSPSAPTVSIPSPTNFANSMLGATNTLVNALTSLAQTKADVRLKDEQAEQFRIDNLTRNLVNKATVDKLLSDKNLNLSKTTEQNVKNTFADRLYKAATELTENEADEAGSKASIASADAAVEGAFNEVRYNQEVERLENLKKEGMLTQAQYNTEVKKLDVMRSEINKNNSQASLNRVSVGLVNSETEGNQLDNRLKAVTFNYNLIQSFEDANQAKLRTIAMRLNNLPHSVSEHFTRNAMFALERIQNGKGKPSDWAIVTAQTAREATSYSNEQAKDWAKILLGAIPMSSSGAASSTPSYIARPSSIPVYE